MEPNWTQPFRSLEITPEKRRRWPWINPLAILGISLAGYILDNISGRVGSVFNTIAFLSLIFGFVLLVNDTVEAGVHRNISLRNLVIGWLLLLVAILVGVYS